MLSMKLCKKSPMVESRATVSKRLESPFQQCSLGSLLIGHIARLVGRRKHSKWNTVCEPVLTRIFFAAERPRFVV